jgi:hypothetical protein
MKTQNIHIIILRDFWSNNLGKNPTGKIGLLLDNLLLFSNGSLQKFYNF